MNLTKVGTDRWIRTEYSQAVIGAGDTVERPNIYTEYFSPNPIQITLGNRRWGFEYTYDNPAHANGIQFGAVALNLTGSVLEDKSIIRMFLIGAGGTARSFGGMEMYWTQNGNTVYLTFSGNPSGGNNGQFLLYCTYEGMPSPQTQQPLVFFDFIFGNGNSNNVVDGFKVFGGSTVAPDGYPLTLLLGNIGGTPTSYINSRWIMMTDGQTAEINGREYILAENENGDWFAYTGSANYILTNPTDSNYAIDDTNGYVRLDADVKYRKYSGDSTYQDISLGTYQVGSTYTVPSDASAGTMDHYNFAGWQYRGQRVYAGQQFQSYPNAYSLTTLWTKKSYTVSFSITQADATPSSLASQTLEYGNGTVLATLTSPTANFDGWWDGSTLYQGDDVYYPSSDITLVARFTSRIATVRFYDADETTIESTQTVTLNPQNPPSVSVPTAPSRSLLFVGWAVKGTKTPIVIASDGESYTPTASVDLIRVYSVAIALTDFWGDYPNQTIEAGYYVPNMTIAVPGPESPNRPKRSGYRFTGWSATPRLQFPYGTEQPTPEYTGYSIPITLSYSGQLLYAYYKSAELVSVSIRGTPSINVRVGEQYRIDANLIEFDPPDYLGTAKNGRLVWSKNPSGYFDIAGVKNGNNQLTNGLDITGVSQTSGTLAQVTLSAWTKTWDSSDTKTATVYVTVSTYILVRFWTRNNSGMVTSYTTANVDDTGGVYTWVGGYNVQPPTRSGYVFNGWVDADGNVVSQTQVPHYPCDVYATWLQAYKPTDRDVVILQKFSNDGTQIVQTIDMGVVGELTERYDIKTTSSPTPTKSSVMTFITDLGVSESIDIKVTRKHPLKYDDNSDDSNVWSNGKWVSEMRKLVDRWQMETDGIKLLYIPRGLKAIPVGSGYAYCGDNYNLIGDVKPRVENGTQNAGILYDDGSGTMKVLQGFNGIVNSYNDKHMAGNVGTIEVSFRVILGGMKAEYVEYSRSLLGMGNE